MFAAGWTNDYVGVPFEEKGRTREGWDCWGLVRSVYADHLGIELPLYLSAYETTEDSPAIAGQVDDARPMWREVEDPRTGDVVLCSVLGYETHVGILVEPGVMLHSMDGRDTCLERIAMPAWSRRIRGIFRHV